MVDLIVPVFNRLEYTQTCLSSLSSVNPGIQLRPIIVDNGSRRRTAEYVESWAREASSCPHMESPVVIRLDQNAGYAAAINAAVRHDKSGEHVFVMHNDCVPFTGWASEMLGCLEEHKDEDAIVVIPRTCYANEVVPCVPEARQRFEELKFPNKNIVSAEEISGMLGKLYPDRDKFMEELRKAPRSAYTNEIASFCMVTEKRLIAEHPFDEDFWPRFFEDKFWFLHYERQGCVCMMSNWSYVHHFGNITTDGPGFSMPDLFKSNEAKFKEKVRLLNDRSVPKKE